MTLIYPTILYGSETWTLRRTEEVSYYTSRRMYGPYDPKSENGENETMKNFKTC